jgi:hypothetical protein
MAYRSANKIRRNANSAGSHSTSSAGEPHYSWEGCHDPADAHQSPHPLAPEVPPYVRLSRTTDEPQQQLKGPTWEEANQRFTTWTRRAVVSQVKAAAQARMKASLRS